MMKGLMGRFLNHEIALDRVKAKARSTEDELAELKAWKTGQEKKLLALSNSKVSWRKVKKSKIGLDGEPLPI